MQRERHLDSVELMTVARKRYELDLASLRLGALEK